MSAKGVLAAFPSCTDDFYHRHFIYTSQSRFFFCPRLPRSRSSIGHLSSTSTRWSWGEAASPSSGGATKVNEVTLVEPDSIAPIPDQFHAMGKQDFSIHADARRNLIPYILSVVI